MEDSNMKLLKQEVSQMIQLSTKEVKTEKIFVCDGIIKEEPKSKDNYSIERSNDNPIPDLDSFKNMKTETFLPIEIENIIEGNPLQSVKIEDSFQIDNSLTSGMNEDQSTSIVPNHCFQTMSSAAMKNEISVTDKIIKKFSCIQCDYNSNHKQNLTRHINDVHKSIKPFNCMECNYKSSRKASLTEHVNAIHKYIKPFSCSECDYKSNRKLNLTRHINEVHKCIKSFNCSQCDYKCSTNTCLTRHINGVHKGIKPFNCSECDYNFARKDILIRHINTAHKV